MSRFDFDGYDDEEGIPWQFWQRSLTLALGSDRGQKALAGMEDALLALPRPRLIHGHLATKGEVCAIGAYVAYSKAETGNTRIEDEIAAMESAPRCECGHDVALHEGGPCSASNYNRTGRCWCDEFRAEREDAFETVAAGEGVGLARTIAWHLAEMNDDRFSSLSPEDRFTEMLAWVRRAQGKTGTTKEVGA